MNCPVLYLENGLFWPENMQYDSQVDAQMEMRMKLNISTPVWKRSPFQVQMQDALLNICQHNIPLVDEFYSCSSEELYQEET